MLIQSQEPTTVSAIREAIAKAVECEHRVPEGYRIAMPTVVSVARLP